jgi:subtilisin family serine protease
MGIYIIRPKETLATRAVGLISKQFAPERRQEQIAEVVSLRNEDPIYDDLTRWLAESPKDVNPLTHEPDTSVTGTKVVEMPDEEAERMRREMPDVLVLRDQPIELIRPARATAISKEKVMASDLWHLKAIGLEGARKRGFKGSGKGVAVAVLDTGIDSSHPELDGKVDEAYTFDVTNRRSAGLRYRQ